jgi:hypothetical protein
MSWIKNISRFNPFSDQMGVHVWVPYTQVIARIFPTRLLLNDDLIDFDLNGPIQNFVVFAEWEKGRIQWYMKTKEGFVNWYLYRKDKELCLELRRAPTPISYRLSEKGLFKKLAPKETLLFPLDKVFAENPCFEKLFFGITKKSEAREIFKRRALEEFLPFCFFLSQMTGNKVKVIQGGIGDLFKEVENALIQKNRSDIGKLFESILSLGFYDLFVPTLQDLFYQRIASKSLKIKGSPLVIFPHLYSLIRRCFIQQEGEYIHLLPCLPKEIAAGRMTDVQIGALTIDMEWRKEQMRRMKIDVKKITKTHFSFPKEIKTYRFRKHLREKGQRLFVDQPLILQANNSYYFDNFMK